MRGVGTDVAGGDFVSIGTPERIHVVMKDRAEFDSIALSCTDHSARPYGFDVLTKALASNGVTVIFQYWIEPPVLSAGAA